MEEKPLGLFCSATDWTMLGCSESTNVVPYRKVLRPGLMVGGAGFLSDPVLHAWGYMAEPKGQLLLSLCEKCHVHGSDSPQWIAPCASAVSLKKEEVKLASCLVSHLPAKWEAEGTNTPNFLHWKNPAWEGSCPTTTSSCCQ